MDKYIIAVQPNYTYEKHDISYGIAVTEMLQVIKRNYTASNHCSIWPKIKFPFADGSVDTKYSVNRRPNSSRPTSPL